MFKLVAVAGVLCLATLAFGAVGYDAGTFTLTYGDPADLDSAVDPAGLADVQESFGIQLVDWNALSPKVIGFNTAPSSMAGTPGTIVATYQAGRTLTFNHFAPLRDALGNITEYRKYNWGCNTSVGRSAFSGTAAYQNLGLIQSDPTGPQPWTVNYRFLSMDTTVSGQYDNLTAFGICLDGNTGGTSGPGSLLFTLDNGTQESVILPIWGGGDARQSIFVGYQAPAHRYITSIEGIRNGGGSCYPASDDWSFLIGRWIPGDADDNGTCEFADYQKLEVAFGTTTGATWLMGDFNGDGAVDFADYQKLEVNFGHSLVPEPATLVLAGLGLVGLLRRRR